MDRPAARIVAEWDVAPVQAKAGAVVLLYALLALFPWACATAVFAFGAGRQWGFEFGHMRGYVDGAAFAHIQAVAVANGANGDADADADADESSDGLRR